MNNRKTTRVSTLKSEVLLSLTKKEIGLGFDFRIVVVVFLGVEIRGSRIEIRLKKMSHEKTTCWNFFLSGQFLLGARGALSV